jgi:hypothetical protein
MISKSKGTWIFFLATLLSLAACRKSGQEQMEAVIAKVNKDVSVAQNKYYPQAELAHLDSLLSLQNNGFSQTRQYNLQKSDLLLNLGEEKEAIQLLSDIVKDDSLYGLDIYWRALALSYLRLGERSNCITMHASESCILPVKGLGVHVDQTGSRKAIEIYERILKKTPNDLESRWLLNIAYMTMAEYPAKVPAEFLIPGMAGDTSYKVKPFIDIAGSLKLEINNMAGGIITDDFDNDGYIDLVVSGWDLNDEFHYFKNNADGTFIDISEQSGLKKIKGGLNLVQTDYNNDGFKDIFVLRGAWKMQYGKEPNSLLRNNGDNTFTDVTIESGLLSFHPTQTATWNDFNNDGWLDVYIGNENYSKDPADQHPCEFYVNNQDGTFTEIAEAANCKIFDFVKGVTSGDFDNDGLKDIFLSTMSGKRHLLKNKGGKGSDIKFEEVTKQANLDKEISHSFPTWFWDYNNDGWLDIFVCDYTFNKGLGYYEAAEKLNIKVSNSEKMLLYRNNHDGTFTNVAKQIGLDEYVFAMGSNFGDIDNDGYLDMYLGTGNPKYQSLVPNKMFKNINGEKFVNVTASARVGHLQKGHGVSFADMDNDGDQDIYIDMGGAYIGDTYQNCFFLNPGQGNNNWISLELAGTKSNRFAIGSKIKVTFKENGVQRSVYIDVNSGGSFGSSPLRKEIGIGQAQLIDEIEIQWHGGSKQIFKNIKPNQFLKITEGVEKPVKVDLKKINWTLPDQLCLPEDKTTAAAK